MAGDSVGDNCDQLLRNQLVFQRGASTSGRMNEVIRQIQAQRDNCVSELWDPEAAASSSECHPAGTPLYKSPLEGKIGDLTIPRSLYTGFTATDTVRENSGRDSDNNIIVYWGYGGPESLPSDAAHCWLYVSRLNSWDQNY